MLRRSIYQKNMNDFCTSRASIAKNILPEARLVAKGATLAEKFDALWRYKD
jgi:hypothetical protein